MTPEDRNLHATCADDAARGFPGQHCQIGVGMEPETRKQLTCSER